MRTSEKTEQVAASLFAVGRDITPPKKNAKADTGKFSYTYLDLPALIEHLRPLLASWQLYITQEVTGGQGFVEITTTIWHLSGQFIELGPTFIPAQGDAQQTGKAITYGRRYSLAAALNIAADEDDDAKPRSGQARPRSDWGEPAPPVTSGLPPDRGTAPAEARGEGATAGAVSLPLDEPNLKATDEQWDRLRAVCGGSLVKAVNRLNKVNRTSYTQTTAAEGATRAEVAAAITGEVFVA